MRLYFWDWHDSLAIQRVDMDFPWKDNDEARKQDCFTNLGAAIIAAKVDLRSRISSAKEELESLELAYENLYRVNPHTVQKLHSMKGT